MRISLQFLGAARTVTGSKYLVTVGNRKHLVDCGLFQGDERLRRRNWSSLPVDVGELDAVIVTHAHIDHVGYLPKLVVSGYDGPIHCTHGTADVARLSLPDSGRLQEEYARYANKKGFSKHKPAMPLYTERDAVRATKLFVTHPFDQVISLEGGVKIRFRRAGHILGSAFVEFWLPDGRMVLFGGDLGRPNTPIIRDPETVEAADYLLVESTYGNRVHPPEQIPVEFANEMRAVCETGGMLVIPAFAIGRTQDVLYHLGQLERAGKCGVIPVFVDSPMAVDATSIYMRHHEDHDIAMEALEDEQRNPLRSGNVTYVRSVDESKALNAMSGPGIIISASGMANGGRILHHLANRLPDPRNTILFVGFQAQGTLGRQLVEGSQSVRVMGQEVSVRARVKSLQALSAHADSEEVLGWLSKFKVAPKETFIVHGEPPAQEALEQKIQARLGWKTRIPEYEEIYEFP